MFRLQKSRCRPPPSAARVLSPRFLEIRKVGYFTPRLKKIFKNFCLGILVEMYKIFIKITSRFFFSHSANVKFF